MIRLKNEKKDTRENEAVALLKSAAKSGEETRTLFLYDEEALKLAQKGKLEVSLVERNAGDGMSLFKLSWKRAFEPKGLSFSQKLYAKGWGKKPPKCENFAQHLLLESMRSNFLRERMRKRMP